VQGRQNVNFQDKAIGKQNSESRKCLQSSLDVLIAITAAVALRDLEKSVFDDTRNGAGPTLQEQHVSAGARLSVKN